MKTLRPPSLGTAILFVLVVIVVAILLSSCGGDEVHGGPVPGKRTDISYLGWAVPSSNPQCVDVYQGDLVDRNGMRGVNDWTYIGEACTSEELMDRLVGFKN